MRLIDADVLQKYLREEYHGMISDESMKIYEILRLINVQPTAYDVEKVIDCLKNGCVTFDTSLMGKKSYVPLDFAIEIVRKGGAE